MQKIIIGLIKLYRKYISPLKRTKCPYYPSCSQYGLEAVRKHGALKGCLLAFWRILRCNPFSKGGYDPVPEPIHIRRKRSARNIVDSEFHADL